MSADQEKQHCWKSGLKRLVLVRTGSLECVKGIMKLEDNQGMLETRGLPRGIFWKGWNLPPGKGILQTFKSCNNLKSRRHYQQTGTGSLQIPTRSVWRVFDAKGCATKNQGRVPAFNAVYIVFFPVKSLHLSWKDHLFIEWLWTYHWNILMIQS